MWIVCPACGSKRAEIVKGDKLIPDRRCKDCGEVYTPDFPAWSSYLLFGVAGLLVVFGVLSMLFEEAKHGWKVIGIRVPFGFIYLIFAAGVGWFAMAMRKKPEEELQEPRDYEDEYKDEESYE